LPDADICTFLNISPEELEQMTNDSSDEWRIWGIASRFVDQFT
jgi:hypothetical protein